ncbi:MAG: TetR/AcrR family transcriptional regulator [Solirubrobacterales bacterium]
MASSTTTQQAPGTRERILAHAVQIASAEGLEALTIGRLATDLGMSKSGLFGHFGSKEELQLATINAGSEIFARTIIVPALKKPAGDERLTALAENFIGYLEKSTFDGGCFWGSVSAEFDNRPGPVRDLIQEKLGHWLNVLREQAKAAGADDPDQLAFELHALGQGANSSYQLFGDPAVFDRARRSIARLLPSKTA